MSKIITVDGYAGCLKSSFSLSLASRLHFKFLSAGTIYRHITALYLKNKEKGINVVLEEAYIHFKSIDNDSNNVFTSDLQEQEIEANVSNISQDPLVIKCANNILLSITKGESFVIDGRNLGCYVFNDAILKIFISSSIKDRMKHLELYNKRNGIFCSKEEYTALEENLKRRDYLDEHRDYEPLQCPQDSITIDLLNIPMDEAINYIEKEYFRRIGFQNND